MLCTAFTSSAKSNKMRFAYSYHQGTSFGVSMMHGSLNDWLRIKEKAGPGPYLWARLDGREYVIREDSVLDELEVVFKPHRDLDREKDKLEHEMRPIERRVDRLEDEIDDIYDRDDENITSQDRARLRQL